MRQGVLITSAAAKVLLVQAFGIALDGRGPTVAADVREDVASRFAADAFALLPRSNDADRFLDAVERACEVHGVGLIVPTRDAELPLFAGQRERFARLGVTVHVASSETVRLCQDKLAFHHFCLGHGFPVPALVAIDAPPSFPIFLRPRTGAGGQGIRRIDGPRAMPDAGEDVLLQEYMVAPEYTVDLLRDLEGRTTVGAVVRQRIEVVGGESQRGRVVDHPSLARLAAAVGEALGLVGHNTVQCFDHPGRGPLLIEVNPRFGGAANLGIAAGLDSPRRLLAMLNGDAAALVPPRIRHGLQMYRYKTDFIVEPDPHTAEPPCEPS